MTTKEKNATSNPSQQAKRSLYVTGKTVRLGDTDSAGRWFYPRWIEMAHEVYEEWLDKSGLPLAEVMRLPVILPVTRCEAVFSKPARLGDRLECTLVLVDIRDKAFTLECCALLGGEVLARCVTTHVAVDKLANCSVLLPEVVRNLFSGCVVQ